VFQLAGLLGCVKDLKRGPKLVIEPIDIANMTFNGRASTLKVINFNTASTAVLKAQGLDRGSAFSGL